jgi:hypothetical protein
MTIVGKWLAWGGLPVVLFTAGCRCERLNGSECSSADRCRSESAWEADPGKQCKGKKHFLRCERDMGNGVQADLTTLLLDPEGRYWIAKPTEMPEAEVIDDADSSPLSWPSCDADEEP